MPRTSSRLLAPLLLALLAAPGAGCGGSTGDPAAAADLSVPLDMARTVRPDFALIPGTCDDGQLNQDESDVDCGGLLCLPCGGGKRCKKGPDCLTGFCQGGLCAADVGCNDGQLNGLETDVDCGGLDCQPCAVGRNCNLDADCASHHCTAQRCTACKVSFAPRADLPAGGGPRAIAAADIDADGLVDLVTANDDNTISVLRRSGMGFSPAASFAVGQGPVAIALGDLDGDGRPDVVTANAAASTVTFLHNAGKGIFNQPQELMVEGALSVAIAEIDGDNRPDLVIATGMSVVVIRDFGQMRFGSATLFPAGPRPLWAAAADLNLDGKIDVVAANGNGAQVLLLKNHGDGTLEAPIIAATAGGAVDAVAALDVDGDGRPDVVARSNATRDVTVLIGTPNFQFAPKPKAFPVGLASLGTMAFGDLDADGRPDLIVPGPADGKLLYFIGQGGQFPASAAVPAGSGPQAVAAADLDGDGRADVAAAIGSDDRVGVLYNRCQ